MAGSEGLVEGHPFLHALTSDELADLSGVGRKQRYRKSSALFVEGDQSDRVLVIQEGLVKVAALTSEGREVVLAIRGAGDLIGDQGFLDGEPRSATATALSPVSAMVIPGSDFTDYLERHPRVAILLLRMLSRRLRDADRKRAEFAAYDTVGRVASRLIEMAERFGEQQGDGIRLTLSLTQDELASWIGASREAASKALSTLRQLGVLETGRRTITILNLEALRQRAA